MTGTRVAVIGAGGYLGGELLRILVGHPGMDLTQAVSRSGSDQKITETFPGLPAGTSLKFTEDPSKLDCDLAFLAMSAGDSLQVVPSLIERGIKVVDLGPDYRLADPKLYSSTYGREHTDPDGLAQAVYGLTELNRERIKPARLVANPGCYPTATLLSIAPLLKAGQLPDYLVVDAKSGTSGAGATLSKATHHPSAALGVQPYGGGNHRHVPEIRQFLDGFSSKGAPAFSFVPHLVPVVRGILCTTYAQSGSDGALASWKGVVTRSYAGEPFVTISDQVPQIPWAVASNRCFISMERAGPSVVIYSVIDNLVKGGAGQAVQNANLMLGIPETEGLPLGGLGL